MKREKTNMRKFILAIISAFTLAGCSPSQEELKQAGFNSINEYEMYSEAGFNTMEAFEQTGFNSLDEYQIYSNYGFKTMKAFEQTGFSSLDEYQMYSNNGFKTMKAFEQTGFSSLAQHLKFKKIGYFSMSEVTEKGNQVSTKQFLNCTSNNKKFDYYKKECQNKTGIWYTQIHSYSSDGVRMKLIQSCDAVEESKTIDAKNLNEQYYNDHKDKCVRVFVTIGDKNIMYPDVEVIETLWAESSAEATERRKALSLAKQKEEEEEKAKKSKMLEENKGNAEWLSEHFQIQAALACSSMVEDLAKYDFKWTDGWLESKFPSYLLKISSPYVLTVTGDKVKFQNGFGAWQKQVYYCDYDTKHEKALRAYIL